MIGISDVQRLSVGRDAGGAVLLDPRSAEAYQAAHIKSARPISIAKIGRERELDPAIERFGVKVVYGDNPGDAVARAAAKRLMKAGYSGVKLFAEGLDAWRRAGLPIEGSQAR